LSVTAAKHNMHLVAHFTLSPQGVLRRDDAQGRGCPTGETVYDPEKWIYTMTGQCPVPPVWDDASTSRGARDRTHTIESETDIAEEK